MYGIGTPAKQTSSLDPAGLKYSVFFLLILSPFPSRTSLQLSNCRSTYNLDSSHNSRSGVMLKYWVHPQCVFTLALVALYISLMMVMYALLCYFFLSAN